MVGFGGEGFGWLVPSRFDVFGGGGVVGMNRMDVVGGGFVCCFSSSMSLVCCCCMALFDFSWVTNSSSRSVRGCMLELGEDGGVC